VGKEDIYVRKLMHDEFTHIVSRLKTWTNQRESADVVFSIMIYAPHGRLVVRKFLKMACRVLESIVEAKLNVSPLRKSYPLKTPDMPAILIPLTITDPAAPRK